MASVIGCTLISMENYRVGVDEGNDLDSIDFDALVQNLQVCICFSPLYYGSKLIYFAGLSCKTFW